MTSQTLTVPGREVRPGDVLFGMTVKSAHDASSGERRMTTREGSTHWLPFNMQVTIERPSPFDPIGTVRAEFVDGECVAVLRKCDENAWFSDDGSNESAAFGDDEVADFPILWKPGMPIPTEGGQA